MRRFNYTGRRKIPRAALSVRLFEQADGALEFEFDIDATLLPDGLPPDAELFVEAYSRTQLERFDLGRAAEFRRRERLRLEHLRTGDHVLFRAKIVDTSNANGRILALASQIQAVAQGNSAQRSMLPVSVQPLDGVIFRIDFPDDAAPTLVLNEELDSVHDAGVKAIAKSAHFASLVFPSAVREILTRILLIEQSHDEEDESSWRKQWLDFARGLNPAPIPDGDADDDPTALLDWIDEAVSQTGRHLMAIPRFAEWLGGQS